jgi:hypothetical protein
LAVERVVFQRDDREQAVSGRLLVTAEDGGLLVVAPNGVLWAIKPDEIVRQETTPEPFRPQTSQQVAAELLAQLPEGFGAHTTAHYVICYNTSRAYAQWCGALYERLYRAFTNFWARRGFDLHEPEFPLAAVVFADVASYRKFAKPELGEAADSIVGYYSLRTNRVTMYDLTGVQALRQPGDRRGSSAEINRMLSRPDSAPNVATIVHEATHQIAFNCGLQTRYADIPLWVSEGIAVYFETPDLKSSRGWRGIGEVNRPRLAAFQRNTQNRGESDLVSLVADDRRLRSVKTAADAYAEAWALNYYLIRKRPDDFVAYLKMLAEKPRLVWDDRETRLAEFKAVFGEDLPQFDQQFVRDMQKLQP